MVVVQGRRYQGRWPHPVVLMLLSSCFSYALFTFFLDGVSSDQGSSLLTTTIGRPSEQQQQETPSTLLAEVTSAIQIASNEEDGANNPAPAPGWHTIQVFYGDRHLLETEKHVAQKSAAVGSTDGQQQYEWFSQTRQDEVVAALFRNLKEGFFVDLAANHPAYLSNTLGLERNLQWKGICIEANPQYWRDLSFRDCQVVAAAVGKNRMENVVFQNAHETGGIVHKNFDQRSVSDAKESMKVYTVQLHEILERIHAPQEIDFFSLDVEGAEEYVMDAFPFDKYKIKVMTIERPKKGLQVLLKNHGYVPIAFVSTFGETLWAHSSYLETLNLAALKQFALPVQAAGFSMNARAVLTEPIYHTQ